MKKIHELTTTLFVTDRGRAIRMNDQIELAFFNDAQRQFLNKHRYIVRKHPQKYAFEVYIDHAELKPSDWTIIHLLFDRRLSPTVKTIY